MLCHITAPGRTYDCVSRSFAPKLSVPEDPVCGSGHCHIIPIMAKKLGKEKLLATRLEAGGELQCRLDGDKISLAGYAAFIPSLTFRCNLPDALTGLGKIATIFITTKAMSGRSFTSFCQRNADSVRGHSKRVGRVTPGADRRKACPSSRRYLCHEAVAEAAI